MQYLSLFVCFILLSIMSSGSTYIVPNGRISFFFKAGHLSELFRALTLA